MRTEKKVMITRTHKVPSGGHYNGWRASVNDEKRDELAGRLVEEHGVDLTNSDVRFTYPFEGGRKESILPYSNIEDLPEGSRVTRLTFRGKDLHLDITDYRSRRGLGGGRRRVVGAGAEIEVGVNVTAAQYGADSGLLEEVVETVRDFYDPLRFTLKNLKKDKD